MGRRPDGRAPDALRPLVIERRFTRQAPGSVLISAGETVVLCTASWTDTMPQWLVGSGHGWLTAEYSMLPGSTRSRKPRDGRSGKQDGRSVEIQRVIGRVLRSVVDTKKLPELSLWVDCDVLSADGSTRTYAITGAWIALHDALTELREQKKLAHWPLREAVAACSVGVVEGQPRLDLGFDEDSQAAVDMTVAMTESGAFAEVHASAEKELLPRRTLDALVELGEKGCRELLEKQRQVLA